MLQHCVLIELAGILPADCFPYVHVQGSVEISMASCLPDNALAGALVLPLVLRVNPLLAAGGVRVAGAAELDLPFSISCAASSCTGTSY